MDRKEFLVYLGIIALAVTGISSVLKNINNPHLFRMKQGSSKSFGTGPYGGIRKETE